MQRGYQSFFQALPSQLPSLVESGSDLAKAESGSDLVDFESGSDLAKVESGSDPLPDPAFQDSPVAGAVTHQSFKRRPDILTFLVSTLNR